MCELVDTRMMGITECSLYQNIYISITQSLLSFCLLSHALLFVHSQAHAAAALINFCEDSRVEELAPFINDLLSALFTRLRDGSRMVQEQVWVLE